ncbi:MAG: tryptophan synthase subunit alpha [Gammaproteobacteria bacterium]|nr:MAG: tryptophan synthase subunit alpha [Gammaproteobacteria bacterium]
MSRIQATFEALRSEGRKALIPYITAGDPHPDHTVDFMHALVESGADMIELGVPFSDPMADGPVIQLACERALSHGTSLRRVLDMVEHFRQTNNHTPVILMGYLNPVEALGYETFIKRAKESGVDGCLLVDLPPEEAEDIAAQLRTAQIDPVFLIAPTTQDDRVAAAARYGHGYLYYVSLKGVTGSAELDAEDVARQLELIRAYADLPLCVGFGIRDEASASAVARVADGVIVGSALVSRIAEYQDHPEKARAALIELMQALRRGVDSASEQGDS